MGTGWNLKLSHKGFLLIAVPLIFEVAIFAAVVGMLGQAEAETAKERQSRVIVEQSNTLLRRFMECGVTLLMFKSTKDVKYILKYERMAEDIPKQITFLESLLKDSADQQNSLHRIEEVNSKGYKLLARAHQLVRTGGSEKELEETRKAISDNTEQIVLELQQLIAEQERTQMKGPSSPLTVRRNILEVLAFALVGSGLLAGWLTFYFNRSTTKRVDVLIDNTKRLSKQEELNPVVAGGDEIAHLDRFFHQMAKDLNEANRRKQELVAMVSHDLRTPLTSIQGSLTLISRGMFGQLNDAGSKQLATAERSSARLIRLINDLLDIEKMESGKLEYNVAECPVDMIVEAAVDSVIAFANERKVEIVYEDQELMVFADAERIVQVITNLLSNAIKFSASQGRVVITAEKREKFIRICVQDFGRGIPTSHLEKVFERFEQVDPNDRTEREGTGLGLPICKAIVTGHGGRIGVDSAYGKGSTFWLMLPTS